MLEIVISITGSSPNTLRFADWSGSEEINMSFRCRNKAEAHEFLERALVAYDVPGREELE